MIFPSPKPAKRQKRRAAGSSLPTSSKPIGRNKKRQALGFARAYGSKERVAFCASLPCAACGVVGFSQNAHLLGNDGKGRKAHHTTIGPLCGSRHGVEGCHAVYDTRPWIFVVRFPEFNPVEVAAETERAWQEWSKTDHDFTKDNT